MTGLSTARRRTIPAVKARRLLLVASFATGLAFGAAVLALAEIDRGLRAWFDA